MKQIKQIFLEGESPTLNFPEMQLLPNNLHHQLLSAQW